MPEGYDFASRYFAPNAGIDEDPVTGSAHCFLAPYWAKKLGKNSFRALQASKRTGTLDVSLQGDRVHMGGHAVTTLTGIFKTHEITPKGERSMMLTMMKGKIHRATVTGSDLNYEGSITIDPALLEAANILPYEQVDVLDINSGSRFTTYAIKSSKRGSGDIIINGAAARLVQKGDLVIICAYAQMDEAEAKKYKPLVVSVDAKNKSRK